MHKPKNKLTSNTFTHNFSVHALYFFKDVEIAHYPSSGPSETFSDSVPRKHFFKPVLLAFKLLHGYYSTSLSSVEIRGSDFCFVPHHCEVFPLCS